MWCRNDYDNFNNSLVGTLNKSKIKAQSAASAASNIFPFLFSNLRFEWTKIQFWFFTSK